MKNLALTFTFALCCFNSFGMTLTEKVHLLFEITPAAKGKQDFCENLNSFTSDLKQYDNLSPKKRIKKIITETESIFFKESSNRASFSELWAKRRFNSITASTLLAILLEELEIPYQVIQTKSNVYLIAYPETARIPIFEDQKSYYYLTENNQPIIFTALVNLGTVKEYEIRSVGQDVFLSNYLQPKGKTNFNTLVGQCYFNRAMYLVERNEYENAVVLLNKGYKYYPHNAFQEIKNSLLPLVYEEMSFDDINIVYYMTQFYAVTTKKSSREQIKGNLKYLYHEAAFSRRDYDFIDSAQALISQNISNEYDRDHLYSYTYLTKAAIASSMEDDELAMSIVKMGYAMNKTDFLFEDAISQIFVTKSYYSKLSPNSYLDSLQLYSIAYPFIMKNELVIETTIDAFSDLISTAYLYNNKEGAEKYNDEMQAYISEHNIDLDKKKYHTSLSSIYSEKATYYYRKRNYTEAKIWIDLAYELTPDSGSIQTRKNQIDKYAK